METSVFCLWISTAAALSIQPDRSQFFQSESLRLHCDVSGTTSDWIVKRNTSSGSVLPCDRWGKSNGPSCIIKWAFDSDTGLYWCESAQGEHSSILSIRVNTGTVILESPAHPVNEGAEVTLGCSQRELFSTSSTSNFRTIFYKNGVSIGNYSEGRMILPSVSKSDEGLYKCQHPSQGESPESLLAVIVSKQAAHPLVSLPRLLCSILLLIVYTVLLVVSVSMCNKWTRARAAAQD